MDGGRDATRHVVAVLVTPSTSAVEVAVPTEVLAGWYEVRLCAGRPGRVMLNSGFTVDAPHGIGTLTEARTVIVPGRLDRPIDPPPAVVRALHRAAARGARIIATGSGSLVLEAAGLTGEHLLTRAGSSATLDACLELVRQAQVVPPLPTRRDDDLSKLLDWATAHLDQPLTLTDMARAASMSPRTLTRRFHSALGTTPIQWLLAQRIRRAEHLLESTSEPVERVARLAGFGSAGNLRQQFTRATGLSPTSYRRRSHRHMAGPRLNVAPGTPA